MLQLHIINESSWLHWSLTNDGPSKSHPNKIKFTINFTPVSIPAVISDGALAVGVVVAAVISVVLAAVAVAVAVAPVVAAIVS